MANLHPDDVVAILGPLSDAAIAAIVVSGATQRDLVEAKAWLDRTVPENAAPVGRISVVVDILRGEGSRR